MNPPPGIEALPNGQWVVAGDTHLGAWAKQHGTIVTDPCLFRWLKPHLEGVRVVWDVGANIGDHTRQYRDWGMDVMAVEPNPTAFTCLKHNCPDAICLPIAASDTEGFTAFTQLDNVGASRITPNGELQIRTRPLDEVEYTPTPDFVKLDIEGHEGFAIIGMAGTLTRHKPILFCEMNAGALAAQGHNVEGLRDMIEHLGYHATALYPPEATWEDPQFDVLFTPIPLPVEEVCPNCDNARYIQDAGFACCETCNPDNFFYNKTP